MVTPYMTIRLLELRLKENSNKGRQLIATSLALISIVMMCANFIAIQIAKAFSALAAGLAITPTLGLSLLLFGAGIHLIALLYGLLVVHNLRTSAILAIFFPFWALLGLGSIMGDHHSLVQVLAWVELGMMILISQIANICFKKERSLWSILQIGLVGTIFLLWLPKAMMWFGIKFPALYNVVPGAWILILGIWALSLLGKLLKQWMKLQTIRDKLLKELDGLLWDESDPKPEGNIGTLANREG